MHHKRKRPRTQSDSDGQMTPGSRHGEAPSRWNILFAHRPRRRRTRKTLEMVLRGADADALTWDLGNRKPHHYYW